MAMIGMSFIFGWLVGMGLPPTATYIIGAVVIVGPMTKLGVNPWVAHFFVFLLSVWGELSPPTSLTAAISARIAEANFMQTMWEALRICLPITLMTFAIFSRSEIVVHPGWTQIGSTLVVTIGTFGTALAMFGRLIENKVGDLLLRTLLMLAAFDGLVLSGRQDFGGRRCVRPGGDHRRRDAPSADRAQGPAGAAGELGRAPHCLLRQGRAGYAIRIAR